MKKIILFFFALSIFLPTLVFAKEKNVIINDINSTTKNSPLVEDFLNITISSNPEIEITKEILPGSSIVFIPAVDKDEINIVFNNLPDKDLYFYVDSLEKVIKHSINEVSTITFSLDGNKPHLISIKSQHSTKTIRNDITGGDCSSFGTWDQTNLICTMTEDVFEVIEIVDDGITLDGNGHMVKWSNGMGIGSGIYISFQNNIIVKNLIVEGFDDGFGVFQTTNSSFLNNETRGFGMGFYLSFNDFSNVINGNTITNTAGYLPGVDITSSGIYLGQDVQRTIVSNNTISVTNYGLAIISDANNNKVYNNNFMSAPAIISFNNSGNYLYQQMPIGGNYYRNYDTPEEGCNDINNDFICDDAISFGNATDGFPWIYKNGWKGERVPDEECCSNVIFIPGFEGSRLYEENAKGGLSQKWEPNPLQSDVQSLFMDSSGQSINSNIVTNDIIKQTNYPIGRLNIKIYQSFNDELDNLKNEAVINDWKDFPYDWRYSVDDIINNGALYADGAHKLQEMVTSLTDNSNSKTGKVTIVAHSNGGLIIKALLKNLEGSPILSKIDKIILVASPQLGTPSATAALLNGDGADLKGGLLMSSQRGRELAKNMPGSYGLLPSEKYFSKTGNNVINFDDSVIRDYLNWIQNYGNSLDYNETKDFLTGGDGRIMPRSYQTEIPNILSSEILNKEELLHNAIDNLQIPSNIKVYEIAGLGKQTINTITYVGSNFFHDFSRYLGFTYLGDGTVVSDSAIDYGFNKSYVNLYKYNKDNSTNFEHSNIFENEQVRNKIENIITDSTKDTSYITPDIPILEIEKPKYKILKMHSPVDLDVYDAQGRHLGINNTATLDSDFIEVDKSIPNSNFIMVDDEKYAIIPDEGIYTVKFDGTGTGLYTFEIESITGDTITDIKTYTDLPVTPELQGQMTIDTASALDPILKIDENGDGIIDQEITPNNDISPISYIKIIRATIIELKLSPRLEKSLLRQVDGVILLIKNNKIQRATDKIKSFLKNIEIGRKSISEMSQTERDDLVIKINNFLNSF